MNSCIGADFVAKFVAERSFYRRLFLLAALLSLLALSGCGADSGEGSAEPDAGPGVAGQQDARGRADIEPETDAENSPDTRCEPTSCAAQGKDCGVIGDGCGGQLECGECADPQSCGGGGEMNVCGCSAESDAELCAAQGAECGSIEVEDSCGVRRVPDCGGCGDSQPCGAYEANQCGFSAAGWRYHTVDNDGVVGQNVSMTLDSAGQPHLAYQRVDADTELKYAFFDGNLWYTSVVNDGVMAGRDTAIVVAEDDTVHLAEVSFEGLLVWSGQPYDWGEPQVVSAAARPQIDLAMDSSGGLHLCHLSSTDALQYAKNKRDGAWEVAEVDRSADPQASVGRWCNIQLDAQDKVYIGYEDQNFMRLKYAELEGGEWQKRVVDEEAMAGGYAAMALDTSGAPVFAYTVGLMPNYVRVARQDSSGWQLDNLLEVPSLGVNASIALDRGGRVHVVFVDSAAPGRLVHAYHTNHGWELGTVDHLGTGREVHTALAIDADDRIYIAYHHAPTGELKVAVKD